MATHNYIINAELHFLRVYAVSEKKVIGVKRQIIGVVTDYILG